MQLAEVVSCEAQAVQEWFDIGVRNDIQPNAPCLDVFA